MERSSTATNGGQGEVNADPFSFARSYQLDALTQALKENTIVFFETGTGKTLIAVMLLRRYAHYFRKPSPYIAVFLVPTVVLVVQQGEVVVTHTDLKVGKYYGEMGVDFWDAATWKQEKDKHEVLVMTPQILLNALRHRFLSLDQIKVLIFDECHNARGKHPYACIMTEFYHRELASNSMQLPRVFGMTASPIKAKVSSSEAVCRKQIIEIENLMNSKVFTCDSESVLAQYINFSTPKVKFYDDTVIPEMTLKSLARSLADLKEKHEVSLCEPNISDSVAKSTKKRLEKLLTTFIFCLSELGICLAVKAAEVFSREEAEVFMWATMDVSGERVVKAFSADAVKVFSAFMPSGFVQALRDNIGGSYLDTGYLTSKIICLIETLLGYREMKDLRCIIFVERIVTAIVISSLLNDVLPELVSWRTEYTAGSTSKLQSQSRKDQNLIVDKFRNGKVNIIVATSMLEEGLDVQSCNLVIRFDLSNNICSFIQSRGRARMQNSDFILMLKSDDINALKRVRSYLASGEIMRKESLANADVPCGPLDNKMYDEPWYEVDNTGAIVTLSSSVALLYFYCSRLPSDGYFKPYPRITIDKESQSCTLLLPSSSPVQTVTVQGETKILKQLACLEACKKLHQVGALTDNLVPDILEEEAEAEDISCERYIEDCSRIFPPELVGYCSSNESEMLYQCYSIELLRDFQYDVNFQDIVLAVHMKLEGDLETVNLDLDIDRGRVTVRIKHIGQISLTSKQVALCQSFQVAIFRILLDRKLDKIHQVLSNLSDRSRSAAVFNYLLLPSLHHPHQSMSIDWKSVNAVLYLEHASRLAHNDCNSTTGHDHYVPRIKGPICCCMLKKVHTKNGLVCCCMLENSIVLAPHTGVLYCIAGTFDGIDGNSPLKLRDGEIVTYKQYYKQRHRINLQFERQNLLHAKCIFSVHNYLKKCGAPPSQEESRRSCELPPEVCVVIMAPVSVSTIYSFSFLPAVMHWIESMLIASNLKSMYLDDCRQIAHIPTIKILEAITTKQCQEKLRLESLETLGDSFLKYAATQQLFKTHQNLHEGLLSVKRKKMISNAALCKLGCDHKITGFIRDEPFDPKTWILPGANCANITLHEESIFPKKFYYGRSRKIKSKVVADVIEALIGAFLITGGEVAALSFMSCLGINVDFVNVPYKRNDIPATNKPEIYINIEFFESLLGYSFQDASLLLEALTHGSYMMPEISSCYQRLEHLGDAVLDYLITAYLYEQNPGLSPGLLTNMRSAQVNNDCYALAAVKARLYKHILHASPELHRQIYNAVQGVDEASLISTFGWESDASFPKVLGDVIESLAGAILVDSGYNKETVFRCMRPLLEPLITPDTLRLHPAGELQILCQKRHYKLKKNVDLTTTTNSSNGLNKRVLSYTVEVVKPNGTVHKATRFEADKRTAKKLACRDVLESLKASEC